MQKHFRRAKFAMIAKHERIKRLYPLLVGKDYRFLRVFSYLIMYHSVCMNMEKQKRWQAKHDP